MFKIFHPPAPPYISNFINFNFTKLVEIYDQGKTNEGEGVLAFKCSQENNKMDVYYLTCHKYP